MKKLRYHINNRNAHFLKKENISTILGMLYRASARFRLRKFISRKDRYFAESVFWRGSRKVMRKINQLILMVTIRSTNIRARKGFFFELFRDFSPRETKSSTQLVTNHQFIPRTIRITLGKLLVLDVAMLKSFPPFADPPSGNWHFEQ